MNLKSAVVSIRELRSHSTDGLTH